VDERHVLIVDDDAAMCRLLMKWLGNAGYHVRAAGSIRAAMDAIEDVCPGVLIATWEMREGDGLELCRWLRQQTLPRYVYTLLLTARCATSDIVRGLEAGADDFVKKPVDRNELVARLRAGSRVLDLEMRLNELAKRDSLTGTFAQVALFERLHDEFERACRHGRPIACVMLDIDFFKRVNDLHGHAAGDRVIRALARLLQRETRATDLVSRYVGEEFCIVLPETNEVEGLAWANRVREAVKRDLPGMAEIDFDLTISAGVAERLDDTRGAEALVDNADQALLVAKRAGRDRVVSFRAVTESIVCGAMAMPSDIFQNVRARDVMTPVVASLHERESVYDASNFFLHFRLNVAPVVDDSGDLVGVVTEKDLIENMLTEGWGCRKVRDIMTGHVIAYEEDVPAIAIYEFLCRVSIRSVVIVRGGQPCGMVSRAALLRWCSNMVNLRRDTARSGASFPEAEDMRSHHTALRLVNEVMQQSRQIRDSLEAPGEHVVPSVIAGSSRIQELITDLLSSAQALARELDPNRRELPDYLVGVDAFR